MIKSILFTTFLFFIMITQAQTIYYVSANGNDGNTGTSWETSFGRVQTALDTAAAGDEIRIESATFFPTVIYDASQTNNRYSAFHCDKSLTIKGGYIYGTNEQNFDSPTIFSGDFTGNDGVSGSGSEFTLTGLEENAYHVMIVKNAQNPFTISNIKFVGGACPITFSTSYYGEQPITNYAGGGLYAVSTNLVLDHVTFSRNYSNAIVGNNASGLYLYLGSLSMQNCNFLENYGTAFTGRFSPVNISHCVFNNNLNWSSYPGALYLSGQNSGTITQSEFNSNFTSGNGGAISSELILEIDECTFINNYANMSGGAFNGFLSLNSSAQTNITNCLFDNNESGAWAGAIFAGNKTTIENSNIVNNQAGQSGGGILGASLLNLNNVKILNNLAHTEGGGLKFNNTSWTANLNNVVFSGNEATNGGAAYMNANFNFQNVLMVENRSTAASSALEMFFCTGVITNSTFYGNHNTTTDPSIARDVYINSGCNATFRNTVFHNEYGDIGLESSTSTTLNGTNNASLSGSNSALYNTPNFVSLSTGIFENPSELIGVDNIWGTNDDGLFPKIGSPLINAGLDGYNNLSTDIAGGARNVGIIDIGAYEYDEFLSTEDVPTNPDNIKIYPTICSADEVIKLESFDLFPISGVQIYNSEAKLLYNKELNINEFQLPNLQAGVYFVKLTSRNGKMFTTKIVVR